VEKVMTKLYGIKNCDTVKKARTWLKDHNVDYVFHNYKKDGVDKNILEKAIATHGWEAVINRRGTTWRQLPDKIKNMIDADNALDLALENSSVIKRPLILKGDEIILGFDPDKYDSIFKA
jgi:arsenate reductase